LSQQIPLELLIEMIRRKKQQEQQQEQSRLLAAQQMFAQGAGMGSGGPLDLRDIENANEQFLTEFHGKVLAEGREDVTDGMTTTMRLSSVGFDDGTYLIPTFDPETRQVVPIERAIELARPNIKSGRLRPFPNHQAAEDFRRRAYPRILRGQKFSELIEPTDRAFGRVVQDLGGQR